MKYLCLVDAGKGYKIPYASFAIYKIDGTVFTQLQVERLQALPTCQYLSVHMCECTALLCLLHYLRDSGYIVQNNHIDILTDSKYIAQRQYAKKYKQASISKLLICKNLKHILRKLRRICSIEIFWVPRHVISDSVINH